MLREMTGYNVLDEGDFKLFVGEAIRYIDDILSSGIADSNEIINKTT